MISEDIRPEKRIHILSHLLTLLLTLKEDADERRAVARTGLLDKEL